MRARSGELIEEPLELRGAFPLDLRVESVVLGTRFEQEQPCEVVAEHPPLIDQKGDRRRIRAARSLDQVQVERDRQLGSAFPVTAACRLQGVSTCEGGRLLEGGAVGEDAHAVEGALSVAGARQVKDGTCLRYRDSEIISVHDHVGSPRFFRVGAAARTGAAAFAFSAPTIAHVARMARAIVPRRSISVLSPRALHGVFKGVLRRMYLCKRDRKTSSIVQA